MGHLWKSNENSTEIYSMFPKIQRWGMGGYSLVKYVKQVVVSHDSFCFSMFFHLVPKNILKDLVCKIKTSAKDIHRPPGH